MTGERLLLKPSTKTNHSHQSGSRQRNPNELYADRKERFDNEQAAKKPWLWHVAGRRVLLGKGIQAIPQVDGQVAAAATQTLGQRSAHLPDRGELGVLILLGVDQKVADHDAAHNRRCRGFGFLVSPWSKEWLTWKPKNLQNSSQSILAALAGASWSNFTLSCIDMVRHTLRPRPVLIGLHQGTHFRLQLVRFASLLQVAYIAKEVVGRAGIVKPLHHLANIFVNIF